jgi:hypothetical protein
MDSRSIRIGSSEPYAAIEIAGYTHPDIAEPDGMDLLDCSVHAVAAPVDARFPMTIRIDELRALRAYLAKINSGNGPAANFAIAGGIFELHFAPSRRGPVLCAVRLKSIDAAHVRVEYMVTLEPEQITRLLGDLAEY